jgi:hypothetical protein
LTAMLPENRKSASLLILPVVLMGTLLAAEPGAPPPIPPEQFGRLHRMIKPTLLALSIGRPVRPGS